MPHLASVVLTLLDDDWTEILSVLFTLSNSAEIGQRDIAYRIFSTTPGIIEKQHEEMVLAAFTKGFKDVDVSVSILCPAPKVQN